MYCNTHLGPRSLVSIANINRFVSKQSVTLPSYLCPCREDPSLFLYTVPVEGDVSFFQVTTHQSMRMIILMSVQISAIQHPRKSETLSRKKQTKRLKHFLLIFFTVLLQTVFYWPPPSSVMKHVKCIPRHFPVTN